MMTSHSSIFFLHVHVRVLCVKKTLKLFVLGVYIILRNRFRINSFSRIFLIMVCASKSETEPHCIIQRVHIKYAMFLHLKLSCFTRVFRVALSRILLHQTLKSRLWVERQISDMGPHVSARQTVAVYLRNAGACCDSHVFPVNGQWIFSQEIVHMCNRPSVL